MPPIRTRRTKASKYQPYQRTATSKVYSGLAKKQRQAVKKIVKQQLRKSEELKYFKYEATLEVGVKGTTGTFSDYRSYNIFYHSGAGTSTITRGTGDNQFLGDKIRWKGIAIKYRIINGYVGGSGVVFNDQPIHLEVFLVKIPALYTTTSLPLTSLYNDTSVDTYHSFLRPGVKIIKKKTIKITPHKAGDKVVRTGKIWLRRDQNIEYADFEGGWEMKDGHNYYLYFHNKSVGGDRINISFAYQNYFVDA